MEIVLEKAGNDALLKLFGRLDVNTSPDLRKAAIALYSKGRSKNVTIDFSEVSFIDTSGLATLLEIREETKERHVQLTLSALNEKVQYLIDVNGLTGFFRIQSPAPVRFHT